MKKHNEGYTLPLVLVVFLVLSLVVVTLLTVALNNLQQQKASIQRMNAQYAAQGKIERVMGRLESQIITITVTEGNIDRTAKKLTVTPNIIEAACTGEDNTAEATYVDLEEIIDDNGALTGLVFGLNAVDQTIQVEASIKVTGQIQKDGTTGGYNIIDVELAYHAYHITTIEEDGGGG